MKNILKLMALFALLLCGSSCNDDDQPTVDRLEVTAANLNGVWQLTEWNGNPLAEATYCYIKFNRKDQTFEMYQNFDSMYARYITGSFSIRKDPYLGAIITGVYDYGNGNWNNEYIVTDLLESGSMVWTATEDESDVNRYVRCDKVPDEIVKEAKAEKESNSITLAI
ncbi:MAG: lipocalin family protein [Bacteroides thetaiotaomicron]|uniref:Lipocalin family protein n=1 Tax=Bacteroides thetaiotaomicron TaxID=818 RepID=A0A943DSP4_BACT4|nr:lipocalin family protein [Bacteroides thetaiotaomicron]